MSDEQKEKISKTLEGHSISTETKRKISKSLEGNSCHLGCEHSEETKERLSEKIKEQYRDGRKSWNKGTKGVCKANSGSFKKGDKINLGRKASKNTKEKMSKARIGKYIGEDNLMWKGNNVGYQGVHKWVVRQKGKASEYQCEHCDKQARHWANIDHTYKRDIYDYISLCSSCHQLYDLKYNHK